MRVTIIGAGVAGLVGAIELAERGAAVEVLERGAAFGAGASWAAGGMLAPWCERESAEAAVVDRGVQALDWWPAHVPGVAQRGTLVVAASRDAAELARFARRTDMFEAVDGDRIAALEPDLCGRFSKGLFFPREAHLDPRTALPALAQRLEAMGGAIRFGVTFEGDAPGAGLVLDCRGFAARAALPELRGVRGEMLLIRTSEVTLSRPVRLLHPRIPLYVVPRGDGLFMVGATMIESAAGGGVTARSAVELLNAAYAMHPAFGEAEIVELRAGVRPSFPDNLPRIVRRGRVTYLNGMHRHGFLLSPAFAAEAADAVMGLSEIYHENHRQRGAA